MSECILCWTWYLSFSIHKQKNLSWNYSLRNLPLSLNLAEQLSANKYVHMYELMQNTKQQLLLFTLQLSIGIGHTISRYILYLIASSSLACIPINIAEFWQFLTCDLLRSSLWAPSSLHLLNSLATSCEI